MFFLGLNVSAKAHILIRRPAQDGLIDAVKSTAADKEDVRRVDLQHFLMRVLAPALRRNAGNGPFEDFQEGLLDTFTGYVAGDRRVF